METGLLLAAAAIVVAVGAWFYPRRPRDEAAIRQRERREKQLEAYGTLQQICETIERMAPKPMGTVAAVYHEAEQRLNEFERNALWNKGALPSVRLSSEQLDEIERLLKEKRSLLEDSTVEAWRRVLRRNGYGSGGGTGAYHELELTSFRKFYADLATNYEFLRKQVGT